MTRTLGAELRKITTTRTWWVLLIAMAVYLALLTALVAYSMTTGDQVSPDAARTIYTVAASMGYAFPLAVGALTMTNEYRYRTLIPTLLARPRRSETIIAKITTSLGLGFVYGAVGTTATVTAGVVFLYVNNIPTELHQDRTLRAIIASIVLLALWCTLGAGMGALITNQTTAVVGILAFTQFLEPILRLVLANSDPGMSIARFLPGAASEAVVGTSFYAASGLSELLNPWQGLLVLAIYGILFALSGGIMMHRRDVT